MQYAPTDNSVAISDRTGSSRSVRMPAVKTGIEAQFEPTDQLVAKEKTRTGLDFEHYECGEFYDELFLAPGVPRPEARRR